MKQIKKERRSGHRTQWTAQFAVASELCKRGYEVAFTMGNHPSVDLMVHSPNQEAFLIDVKGLYKKNYWAVSAKKAKPNLFYVLAFVPDHDHNRYFILTQEQVNAEVEADLAVARARKVSESFPGITWKRAEQYEGAWNILPK
jgi:hypothetical protein